MPIRQMAVIATHWVGGLSMPHLLPEDESNCLHTPSIPVISERGSGKSGRGGIEQELLLVPIPVGHLLDCPNIAQQDNIPRLASHLTLEITSDMARVHKLHHRSTTPTRDTILGKVSEWTSVVHHWYGMTLEHIRQPRLLPVELRPRGSKRKTSLGRHRRRQRMKV